MTTALILALGTPSIKALLIGFLLIALGILAIAGLIWLIENYISPVPTPIKLILAIVILVLIVLWVCGVLGIL